MAKKKRTAYEDLQEQLGLEKYDKKRLARENIEMSIANARRNPPRPSRPVAPIRRQPNMSASDQILMGNSNPFSIENMQVQQQARRQQEQKELEEKAKKQSQSTPAQSASDKSDNVNLKLIKTVNEMQHKKVDELGKKVGEETERLGILNDFSGNDLGKVTNIMFTKNNNNSRKLLNDKLFADKFNNQFSDKIRISDKQQTSAEKLTGRKIEKLDKKKGETDFQAIIRAQQENTKKRLELEKTDLYKQYAKEHNTELLTQYLYDTERVKSEKTTTEDKINPIRGFMSGLKSSLSPRDYVDENGRRLSLPNYNQLKTDKVIQDSGKLGKAYQGAMTSAGQMAPAMLASAVPRVGKALGLATTWVTTYNSAKNQKMLEGYSEEEAEKYAKVNASLETGLGGTLGGLTKIMGGKQSAFASNIQKLLDKFVTNKGVSRFASQAFAEVTEEELQNVLDPINEHLTLGKYKNLDEALGKVTLDDATTTALSTLMLVGITEGRTSKNVAKLQKDIEAINKEYGTDFKFKDGSNEKVVDKNIGKETKAKDLVKKAKTGVITTNDMEVDKNRKLSDNEQMVVDNVVENRRKALEEENGKVSAREIKKIKKEVTQSMREGTLDVNDIERVMSNEEWTRHSEANKQSENLKAQIQELESKSPTDYNTMGEINSANEKLSNLKAELNNIDTKKTKDELTNSVVSKLTDDDILLKQNLINSETKQSNIEKSTNKSYNIPNNVESGDIYGKSNNGGGKGTDTFVSERGNTANINKINGKIFSHEETTEKYSLKIKIITVKKHFKNYKGYYNIYINNHPFKDEPKETFELKSSETKIIKGQTIDIDNNKLNDINDKKEDEELAQNSKKINNENWQLYNQIEDNSNKNNEENINKTGFDKENNIQLNNINNIIISFGESNNNGKITDNNQNENNIENVNNMNNEAFQDLNKNKEIIVSECCQCCSSNIENNNLNKSIDKTKNLDNNNIPLDTNSSKASNETYIIIKTQNSTDN